MAQFARLGILYIFEQGTGSTERHAEVLGAETGQILHGEVPCQPLAGAALVEVPGWQPLQTGSQPAGQRRRGAVVGDQHFGRLQPFQFAGQPLGIGFEHAKIAAGQRQRGNAESPLAPGQRNDPAFALVVEQCGIGQRARGDHPDHLALDRSLAGGRVADLLADRHRFTETHQSGQVLLDGMERHAGHRNRLAAGLAAGGQRDVHQPCGLDRVVVEHLVEVAHAVEQQAVRVVGLQPQILLHHRGVLRRAGGIGCGGGCRLAGHRVLNKRPSVGLPGGRDVNANRYCAMPRRGTHTPDARTPAESAGVGGQDVAKVHQTAEGLRAHRCTVFTIFSAGRCVPTPL